MARRKTTEEFIAEAKAVHGNKYDYSKSSYTGSDNKIEIVCPEHGVFWQLPFMHVQGQGCKACYTAAQTMSNNSFIKKANSIHNSIYNYDKALYVNSDTKVIITCTTHGDFSQTPKSHLSGRGCSKCAIESLVKYTTEEFIKKAHEVHGSKYKYNKSIYITGTTDIIITCDIHGDFKQEPRKHLEGSGCSKCNKKHKHTTDEWVSMAVKLHPNLDYSKAFYTNAFTNVVITCPVHGDFTQRPGHHLKGQGCPSCADSGFNKSKPAILYYLRITTEDDQLLYKIGITNRTVEARFNLTDLQKIEIVKQKLYDNGSEALEWETKLKQMYKQYQYKGPDILSSGNTELFTEDIITMYYRDNGLTLETS